MSKGQLPYILLAIIFLAMIFKIPPEDVSQLARDILAQLRNMRILGWLLSVLLALGWFSGNKRLRRRHRQELKRISGEKKHLQEKLVLRKLDSSDS